MLNATELSLTTQAIVDDGTALLYAGPLTEVTLWRNERTGRMEHAQPGDYIVKDVDGFPRRYSAADFGALFEAAPTPTNITGLTKSTTTASSIVMTWTDAVGTDKVNIYKNGVFLAQVNHGVQTYTATGLDADTAYTFTARTVNSYGQLATVAAGSTLTNAYTLPVAPAQPTLAVLGATALLASWVPSATDLTSSVQIYVDGVSNGAAVAAGVNFRGISGLTTATLYSVTLKAVGAVSGLSSAPSTARTATTS